eukprot:1182936-Prorocentrum_minimum.AAC.1
MATPEVEELTTKVHNFGISSLAAVFIGSSLLVLPLHPFGITCNARYDGSTNKELPINTAADCNQQLVYVWKKTTYPEKKNDTLVDYLFDRAVDPDSIRNLAWAAHLATEAVPSQCVTCGGGFSPGGGSGPPDTMVNKKLSAPASITSTRRNTGGTAMGHACTSLATPTQAGLRLVLASVISSCPSFDWSENQMSRRPLCSCLKRFNPADQSDAGSGGIFSRRTNHLQQLHVAENHLGGVGNNAVNRLQNHLDVPICKRGGEFTVRGGEFTVRGGEFTVLNK